MSVHCLQYLLTFSKQNMKTVWLFCTALWQCLSPKPTKNPSKLSNMRFIPNHHCKTVSNNTKSNPFKTWSSIVVSPPFPLQRREKHPSLPFFGWFRFTFFDFLYKSTTQMTWTTKPVASPEWPLTESAAILGFWRRQPPASSTPGAGGVGWWMPWSLLEYVIL